MPKAKERDGVYYRKDRAAWAVSYIDASGERQRKIVAAHTRQQAKDVLSAMRTQEERARTLGVRPASEITTKDLMEHYKRHQKALIRPTTYARLGGILTTLKAHLPEQAKAITKRTVAAYIETRSEMVKPGTVAKKMSVLKHCLKLAVEWDLLHENAAAGARLPKVPPGRTKYLTPGELKAALEAAPEWMRAPMAFAACTGVRRGEMLSLRWMDVDMGNRRLYLRETKNGALRVLPSWSLPLAFFALCRLARREMLSSPVLTEQSSRSTRSGCCAARHPGRQLSCIAPHSGELVGDGGCRPVRSRTDFRPQDAANDATLRAFVARLHGRER